MSRSRFDVLSRPDSQDAPCPCTPILDYGHTKAASHVSRFIYLLMYLSMLCLSEVCLHLTGLVHLRLTIYLPTLADLTIHPPSQQNSKTQDPTSHEGPSTSPKSKIKKHHATVNRKTTVGALFRLWIGSDYPLSRLTCCGYHYSTSLSSSLLSSRLRFSYRTLS